MKRLFLVAALLLLPCVALAQSTAAPVLPGVLTNTLQPNCSQTPCFLPYSAATPIPTSPYANANLATSQVSVGATATQIVAARSGRGSLTIENAGTTALWIGADATVTSSTGFLLPGVAGASVTVPSATAVFGITGGGSQTVTVLETF